MAEKQLPPDGVITVPSDDKPTLANSLMLDGAIIGTTMNNENPALGALIGGMAGGTIGKDIMEHDYQNGVKVRPPLSLGIHIALNAALFGAVTIALAVAVGAAAPVMAAVALSGATLGAYSGNFTHNMAVERYENAKAYYAVHGGNYEGREREAQKATQITPEETKLLEGKLAARARLGHVDSLIAEKPFASSGLKAS